MLTVGTPAAVDDAASVVVVVGVVVVVVVAVLVVVVIVVEVCVVIAVVVDGDDDGVGAGVVVVEGGVVVVGVVGCMTADVEAGREELEEGGLETVVLDVAGTVAVEVERDVEEAGEVAGVGAVAVAAAVLEAFSDGANRKAESETNSRQPPILLHPFALKKQSSTSREFVVCPALKLGGSRQDVIINSDKFSAVLKRESNDCEHFTLCFVFYCVCIFLNPHCVFHCSLCYYCVQLPLRVFTFNATVTAKQTS